jgi:simple sugar transport system ATP-binding protein
MSQAAAPLLRVEGLSKSFPGVRALDKVDFSLRGGEIMALLGENGAGKSTLIKVLTGVYEKDEGEIFLSGKPVHPRNPREAQSLGISTVYQEVNLIPRLSVAENICLGREPGRFACLDWREIRARARRALARLDLQLDEGELLGNYSIALQQMVAIARALDTDATALVLDEPTSSLDEEEVNRLFAAARRLRAEGLGVVFVTHFLDQVYRLADRITVLRNGRLVGVYEAADLPRIKLISLMMGRELSEAEFGKTAESGEFRGEPPLVELRDACGKGLPHPIAMEIRPKEILGLAGLLGSGRTETARLIFGLSRLDHGELKLRGRKRLFHSCLDAIRERMGYCPEDRKTEGIIPNLSLRENIVLALQAGRGWFRRISPAEQSKIADRYIKELRVAAFSPEQPIRLLSGGNQQKAILARWLASQPILLILDEPTRGIDVGAKLEIERLIAKLAAEGMAILFISSDLEETCRNCHRAVILRDRRVVGELLGSDIREDNIIRAIAGTRDVQRRPLTDHTGPKPSH